MGCNWKETKQSEANHKAKQARELIRQNYKVFRVSDISLCVCVCEITS